MDIVEAKTKADGLVNHGISLTRQEMRRTIAALSSEVDRLEVAATHTACPECRDVTSAKVARLVDALRPFANYACDPPCGCHNCTAKALVDEVVIR